MRFCQLSCPIRSVQPSASIQSFDALCEVQSDKASVEITSPFDGIVKELLVKEGEVAKVGEGLCIIEVDTDEHPSSEDSHSSSPPHHQAQEAKVLQDAPTSEPPKPTPEATPVSTPKARKPHPLDPNVSPEAKASIAASNAENVLATPSVRHFARESCIDLAKLAPGSGKGGRIEKRDVEAYLAGPKDQSAAPATASRPAPPDTTQDIVVELGRTRYGMWKAMVKVRAFL